MKALKPQQFRENIILKFNDKINNYKKSKNLEISIYNYCINKAIEDKIIRKWSNNSFLTLYLDKVRTIYNNMNEYLINLINENIIKTKNIGQMDIYQLNLKKWEPLINQKKIRDKVKFENTNKQVTSLFVCKKCRSKNCTYQCIQTRSADEPITTFISCVDCGFNWKMN